MNNVEIINDFITKNIDKYDFEVKTKPSVGGKALFIASIDKIDGGNYASSGFEYNLEDALQELVNELKKAEK